MLIASKCHIAGFSASGAPDRVQVERESQALLLVFFTPCGVMGEQGDLVSAMPGQHAGPGGANYAAGSN